MKRPKTRKASRRRGAHAAHASPAPPHTGYTDVLDRPHELELKVRHELLSESRLRFGSLIIHRIEDGVCLEGVVQMADDAPDICGVAQRVEGVQRVVNRLVVHRPHRVPVKG